MLHPNAVELIVESHVFYLSLQVDLVVQPAASLSRAACLFWDMRITGA
jgi:hypothetical protein